MLLLKYVILCFWNIYFSFDNGMILMYFYTVINIDQAGYNTFDEKLQDEIVHWKTFTKKHLILLGFYGKIS